MKSITLFFETSAGKRIKNLIIGLGASIVLLGALFKLQHWKFASEMLIIGMCTEAFIFALLGILPPHKDYYWERYYPDLDENPHVEAYRKGIKFQPTPVAGIDTKKGASASGALDKMLDEAELNPANLRKLSENFQRFGQTVNQIKDISEAHTATNEYTNSAREAASALGAMSGTFANASATMVAFNNAAEDTTRFHQQVQVLSKNLGALNQIYEVELRDANNHLKAMNRFYSNLVTASDAMAASADDAAKAKEQIGALAGNLTRLNQIYGNMLNAMQGRA